MATTKVLLEIPSEVLTAVKFPPAEVEQELRKELALALYQRGALAIGPARLLARRFPVIIPTKV